MITLNGVIIFPCTYFVLSFMLSFDVIIFHGQQMLSFICYHFPFYIFCVIIYVIICVIIYCYHFPPFFFFLKTWHTPGQDVLSRATQLDSDTSKKGIRFSTCPSNITQNYIYSQGMNWGGRAQSYALYRGPTDNEFVQHFAYRGSSHRRMGALLDM